mmetsp:Transcript_57280/g.140833  ORF Transcript_57280/g.140833 Transcript_57280/m.140833 type:complete len:565 (+) Transcript_57280:377-2071(+)
MALKEHVAESMAPEWPRYGPGAAQVVYLAHGIPLLLQDIWKCRELTNSMDSFRKNMFTTVSDWRSPRVWLRQQVEVQKSLDTSTFIKNRPRWSLQVQKLKAVGVGRSLRVALRTAVLVTLISILGFLDSTTEFFSVINGTTAVATGIVIASEKHFGRIVRKGFSRAGGLGVAVLLSSLAWIAGRGDQRPAVTLVFHVVVHLVSSYIVRIRKLPYLGFIMTLMFGLTLDAFIFGISSGTICPGEGCPNQFFTSSLRFVGVLGALLVVYIGSLLLYPTFASKDLRLEYGVLARDIYFMYALRVLAIRQSNYKLSKRLSDLVRVGSGEQFSTDTISDVEPFELSTRSVDQRSIADGINLLGKDVLRRVNTADGLIVIATQEPRIFGPFDEEEYRRILQSLVRIARRVSIMFSYERMQEYSYENFQCAQYAYDIWLIQRVGSATVTQNMVNQIIIALHVLSTTYEVGSFLPMSLYRDLCLRGLHDVAGMEKLFSVRIVVDSPMSSAECMNCVDGTGTRSTHLLDITRPLPMLLFLRLNSFARINWLLKEIVEDSALALGVTDVMGGAI